MMATAKSKKEDAVSRIERINERVWLVHAGSNNAIVQFSRGDDASFEPSASVQGMPVVVGNGSSGRQAFIMPNGARNDMPQARERLIADNNVVGTLMETKRDVWIGLELVPVEKKIVNGVKTLNEVDVPESEAFFESINIDTFMLQAFGELCMHGMFIPELVRDKGGRIISAEVKKSRHMRSGVKDDYGKVRNWYWCGDWLRKSNKRFPVQEIPVYDPTLEGLDGWKRQGKFVMPTGISLLSDDYYDIPAWQGSRDWLELANMIPQFHLYNLENGFTPRWHVTIPQDYFKGVSTKGLTAEQLKEAESLEDAARTEFLGTLNKYLAGLTGVGRAMVTDEYWEPLAKQFVGIKIKPLEVDLKDGAMLPLYEKSNQAVIGAQGIHPTLAAIETGQTRAGGSEILRALQLYQMTKTRQPRLAVLRFFNFVHRVNGWGKGVKWVFRDETLTTLAETADGQKDKPLN